MRRLATLPLTLAVSFITASAPLPLTLAVSFITASAPLPRISG